MIFTARQAARHTRQQLTHNWDIAGPYQWATVVATHATPNTVDVKMDGSTYTTAGVRYLSSYTPTINDVVLIARMQGASRTARVVLGKLS